AVLRSFAAAAGVAPARDDDWRARALGDGVTETKGRQPTGRPAGVAGARRRGPQLTRGRQRGVVAATTGLLGLSSTRRAAILALVVCVLALTVVVPLRNYVSQREELAATTQRQQALAAEVAALQAERARLSDPAEVEAQARSRLGYVLPGEVPYVVQLPSAPPGQAKQAGGGAVWYRTLWRQVAEGSP
ncbi:MAG TPA: septum formation initiator family protein, partial [Pseudonocardia sp.]